MRVALGWKAHSGWAALVALGRDDDGFVVIERRRVELVADPGAKWAGQPYHAAEYRERGEAHAIVERGNADARRAATVAMRGAIRRMNGAGHAVVGCAVVVPAPMPAWTIDEILAVHLRMHKAEGVLYPEALVRAAETCALHPHAVAERVLGERAGEALGINAVDALARIAALGRTVGPPWGSDQKNAALAACVALVPSQTLEDVM